MENLIQKIKQSKKYRNIPEETIARVIKWAMLRAKKEKEIEKVAKNKLHQVYGAYFDQTRIKKVEKALLHLETPISTETIKSTCRDILQFHASSKERLPLLDEFYFQLFQLLTPPKKIMDLACGLNPFTLPWMLEQNNFFYYAADIDHSSVDLFNRFFQRCNYQAQAFTNDLLLGLPDVEADTYFLFKTLPCLEQQEKGISLKILRQLAGKQVVVSFPSKSLGGKEKGMYEHYHAFFENLMSELNRNFSEIRLENETVYLIRVEQS